MRDLITRDQTYYHAVPRRFLISARQQESHANDPTRAIPIIMTKAYRALNLKPHDVGRSARFAYCEGTKWVAESEHTILAEISGSQAMAHARHDPTVARGGPSSFDRARERAGQPSGQAADSYETARRRGIAVLRFRFANHSVACLSHVLNERSTCHTRFIEVVGDDPDLSLSHDESDRDYMHSRQAAEKLLIYYCKRKRDGAGPAIEGIRYPSVHCDQNGRCIAGYRTTWRILRDSLKVAFPSESEVIHGSGRRPPNKDKRVNRDGPFV